MTHLLYLDIWGTSAKLLPGEKTLSVFAMKAFTAQRLFLETLVRASAKHPELSIQAQADHAWISGTDLKSVADFAIGVFQNMCSLDDVALPLPLRGVIASGEVQNLELEESKARLVKPVWFGEVATLAARVEKSAQKGFRLFAEEKSAPALSELIGGELIRESNAKGLEAFEVNWLKAKSECGRELASIFPRLQTQAKELVGVPDPFAQTLGSTLSDLLRW